MLVRSPTLTKSDSSVTFSGSRPDSRIAVPTAGTTRGATPAVTRSIAEMWSGVVPQQPPTMFTRPASVNSSSTAAIWSAVSSYSPNAFGRPAFG